MPGRPFKRAEARQAHKETASVVIDGKTHLAPREAVAFLKVSYPTLKKWANPTAGCPWLDWEALRTEKHPTAYSRKITYFLKEDLTRVRDAKCKRVQVPEYPGLTNLHDAYEQLGVSRRTLRRMAKSHVPPVRIVEKSAKSTNGWAHPKAYISTEFVEEMKAARKSPPVPADRMTVAEAAKELKRKTVTIHKYARQGQLDVVLGKKLVDAAPRNDDAPRLRYARKATLVSRESVERFLKRERNGETNTADHEKPALVVPDGPNVEHVFALGHHLFVRSVEMVALLRAMVAKFPCGLDLNEVRKLHTKGNTSLVKLAAGSPQFSAAVVSKPGIHGGGYRIRSTSEAISIGKRGR